MDNSHDSNKPVAWINTTGDFLFQHPEEHGRENEEWFPLVHQNTSPPASKPWVWLTQQDINIAFDDTQEGGEFDDFARAIETKLREKNAPQQSKEDA